MTNILGFYGNRDLGRDSGIDMGKRDGVGGLGYCTMAWIAGHFGQEEIIFAMYKLNGTDPESHLTASCLLPMSVFYIILPLMLGGLGYW